MSYVSLEDSACGISFFERLEADQDTYSVTQGPDAKDVLISIKRHISNLLNTRVGDSQSAPSLGLIDFNDTSMSGGDLASAIAKAIGNCLIDYEPRLKNVSVKAIPDETCLLNARFHITAQINYKSLHEDVQLDLLLDQNHKYRVIS